MATRAKGELMIGSLVQVQKQIRGQHRLKLSQWLSLEFLIEKSYDI